MKLTITARELPDLLDRVSADIRYLSLDCFDTLLWRNVVAPRDVFADLPIEGGGIWTRSRAEARARRFAFFDRGKNEARIEEIYRAAMPNADDAVVAAAVQTELDAESRHCYAFAPTVELMKAAKARGLKIVIVSDTYLSEEQLRQLIGRAAGDEVAAMLDHVFVSADHGISKGEGLFKTVLKALNAEPGAIFHVGDNINADQRAPAMLGIASAHLRQFGDDCAQRLRLEASAATMMDGKVRATCPAFAPHRPVLSIGLREDPVEALGHDVLGPIMHSFVNWLEEERQAMASRLGRSVKLLYMMRDGHLPLQVHRALFPHSEAAPVELSRFAARRASFVDEDAVRSYLATEEPHGRTDVIVKQLGLTKEEGDALTGGRTGGTAQEVLNRRALEPATVAKVVERSAAFADKLMTHLESIGVERGDAVMLADLGYAGSVQNLIEPVLRDRFGMTIAGRYLLLRDPIQTGYDKQGLIDTRHYDIGAVHALSMPISVVEQLSTVSQGSVENYTADGSPVRKASGHKAQQNSLRDRIQAACVDYATHASGAVLRAAASDGADCRRQHAGAVLARFLFMPTAKEVAVLQSFEHDVNLGTSDMVSLVNTELAGAGLRQRGLFYVNQSNRMYLPGELQQHGFSHVLAMFAASRYQFDLRPADFHAETIGLQAFVADSASQMPLAVDANLTHDGYFQATVPIGAGRFAVGVQLGDIAEWVQVEEAAFHTVAGLYDPTAAAKSPPIPAQVIYEGMEEHAPGFFRCGEAALLLVPPPPAALAGKESLVFSFVFRPVVRRTPGIVMKEAA
jgi:FMN phosphatase YigB (HAD superfamily)